MTTVVPFGELNKSGFKAAVARLNPSGYTPIGTALTEAAGRLPEAGKRAIVLVSDGIDTCAPPDPCKVAADLHAADKDLVIHTVGFKVTDDPKASEQLSCIAREAGGIALDATNAEQLKTRLAVAFTPGLYARSLQPGGYRGLTPGMTVEQARRAVPKLPQVGSKGRVVVVYVDCDLVFDDGLLTAITPRNEKVKTIDGIGIGDDIADAEKLYGDPAAPSVPEKNTITYPADTSAGTGFKISFKPSAGIDTVSGKITKVILCRCAPGADVTFSDNPDEWPSGPGYIGPIKAGANVQDLIDDGWAAQVNGNGTCGSRWQLSDSLYPRGIFGDFRDGDPDALDGLTVGDTTPDGSPARGRYLTAEGIGIGSTTKQLRAAYGDLKYGQWSVEGGQFSGYVQSTPQGSIMFNVGDTSVFGPGDGSHVTHIVVTADTSATDFQPPVGGC